VVNANFVEDTRTYFAAYVYGVLNGAHTELIYQVASLPNSGLVPSSAGVPLPRYSAFRIFFSIS